MCRAIQLNKDLLVFSQYYAEFSSPTLKEKLYLLYFPNIRRINSKRNKENAAKSAGWAHCFHLHEHVWCVAVLFIHPLLMGIYAFAQCIYDFLSLSLWSSHRNKSAILFVGMFSYNESVFISPVMQLLSIVQPMKMLLTCFTCPFVSIHAEIFNGLKEKSTSGKLKLCWRLHRQFSSMSLKLPFAAGVLYRKFANYYTAPNKNYVISIKCLFVT